METKTNKPTPRTIFNETFGGFVILLLSSFVIGKFFNPPLGSVILAGAVVYAFSALFFGFFTILFADFLERDDKMRPVKPEEATSSDDNAGNYLLCFAVVFVVLWIALFAIFPENTTIGDLLRESKFY